MDAGLYIVGTPIGNLADISARALDTLRGADLVLAEDTRHTRKLLARYDMTCPMTSCHKFSEASRVALVLRKIGEEGEAVALVSNAGMPAVSDPGARLVAACRAKGFKVEVIPGPSAVTAAVALSGFGGGGFHFEGFLSHKSGARKRRLAELSESAFPVILFESPHRIERLLGEVEEVMNERPLLVAREMTKQHEEALSGPAASVREQLAGRTPRGEFTVVIAPRAKGREGQRAGD
jgi:16S rRNA (cytidine1402-2'-O)-methyltransferase